MRSRQKWLLFGFGFTKLTQVYKTVEEQAKGQGTAEGVTKYDTAGMITQAVSAHHVVCDVIEWRAVGNHSLESNFKRRGHIKTLNPPSNQTKLEQPNITNDIAALVSDLEHCD